MIANPMPALKAPRLKKGDLIALVSPASPPSAQEKIDGGVRYLENRGYNVVVGKHAMDVHGYLAGRDEVRLEDLNGFIRDERVKAIIAIRGGYGTPRLLADIDYDSLRKKPKVIVGYSDLTGLQLAILAKTGLMTFSGPMSGVEMWNAIDPYTEENFWRMVESGEAPGELKNPQENPVTVLKKGKREGRLVGGNFSLLINLTGTPYVPPLKDAVLALEDVDEAPHRIDRMLVELRHTGALSSISALLFGQFTDCLPSDRTKPFLTVEELQREFSAYVEGPVLSNVQFGHIPRKITLPLGALCTVDGDSRTIKITESVVV